MKQIYILPLLLVTVTTMAQSRVNNNWMASDQPLRDGHRQCVRNGVWTPATAHPDCEPDIKPAARSLPVAPPPVVQPTPSAPPAPPAVPTKVTLQADTLFDFDRSVIKPEGRARLNRFVADTQGVKYTVVIVVGHTDSVGSDEYNMRLGLRRAEAVKAYLVNQGMAANQIQTSSRGKREPVADNRTAAGRALNRRVVIEINGQK